MSHILITAGPTRAYIDDVRYLTNASSGRMACALAEAALAKGHSVSIVSGPVSVQYPAEARVSSVITTGDMLKKSLTLLPRVDGVIATAIVTWWTRLCVSSWRGGRIKRGDCSPSSSCYVPIRRRSRHRGPISTMVGMRRGRLPHRADADAAARIGPAAGEALGVQELVH